MCPKFCIGEVRYWKGKYKGILIAKQVKSNKLYHPILKKWVTQRLNTGAFKLASGKIIITPLRKLFKKKKGKGS